MFFSTSATTPRICGVGGPKGEVHSPIFFNLYLRLLNNFLPVQVRTTTSEGQTFSRVSDFSYSGFQIHIFFVSLCNFDIVNFKFS